MMPNSLNDVALVTGASSGLGVHFAHLLAQRGWDVALVARRGEQLQNVADDLRSSYGVQTHCIPMDLAHEQAAEQLEEAVTRRQLSVRVLINNAGMGHYGAVADQSESNVASMIQLNVATVAALTRRFALSMEQSGGGYILQNASFSAFVPMPRYAVYAATKSFVVSLTLAMRHELRKANVQVSALCPGFTRTEFFETAGHSPSPWMRWIMLEPEKVAQQGLDGLFRHKRLIVPGLAYKMARWLLWLTPDWLAAFLAARLIKTKTKKKHKASPKSKVDSATGLASIR